MSKRKLKPSIKWGDAPKGTTHAVIHNSDRGVIITWDKIENNNLFTWINDGQQYGWKYIGHIDLSCAEKSKTRIKRPGS